MATYYIDPDASGGGAGSEGDPYNWADIRGSFASSNTYLVKNGTTSVIGAASAAGWLDFSGLTNVTLGIWEYDGSVPPIFDGMRDISAYTWTEVNDSDVPTADTNKWRATHTHLSGGTNLDRVFFDKVGQARASSIANMSTTLRVYKKTGYVYIYSTSDPGEGTIDGVSKDIEMHWDIELINLTGADQIFIRDIEFWGNKFVSLTITADITQVELERVRCRYLASNKTTFHLESNSTYNISGVKVHNCIFDLHAQEGECGELDNDHAFNGSSNCVQCKGQTGPSTGGSVGDGLWVKDCIFNGYGHTAVRAKAGHAGEPYTNWWTRCVLIEGCKFDFTNTVAGRAFGIGDSNCEVITVRNLYIKHSRSSPEIGSSGGEYYNIIMDTPKVPDDAIDGDNQRSGCFELYTNVNQGGIVENNDIHSWTCLNAEGCGITFHSGGMQGGTGNTIRNMLFVNCSDDNPILASLDGIVIYLAGTYASQQNITWSNIVFHSDTYSYNDSTDEIIQVTNSSSSSVQYALSDIGTDPVDVFSNIYCTDPSLNETNFTVGASGSAYDAGADVGIIRDYYGNPRPGGSTYDIGAVETPTNADDNHVYSLKRTILVK